MLASEAFNPDVSPQPDHLPLITAAGVLLLEANHITQLYLHNHLRPERTKEFPLGGMWKELYPLNNNPSPLNREGNNWVFDFNTTCHL